MMDESNLSKLVCGYGSHYSVWAAKHGMGLLRAVFPDAIADDMNFCLFSTSGVHGTYQTIEEEKTEPGIGVTFLIVKPRLVVVQYGLAYPTDPDDFDFLVKLRQTSWAVMATIGAAARE